MPIDGIIDNDFVNEQVKATAQAGASDQGTFDPNLFLKILMSQLENQSPFDTVDSQQILEQQAILTQVEQSTRSTGFMQELKDTVTSELTELRTAITTMNQTLTNIADKI